MLLYSCAWAISDIAFHGAGKGLASVSKRAMLPFTFPSEFTRLYATLSCIAPCRALCPSPAFKALAYSARAFFITISG